MRKIDADKIKFEVKNGEMVATKESIDALEEIKAEAPAMTRLQILGFTTRCEKCGFERFFPGTDIGEYRYCEKCGNKVMTQEESENVDQDTNREDNT